MDRTQLGAWGAHLSEPDLPNDKYECIANYHSGLAQTWADGDGSPAGCANQFSVD